MFTGLVEEVGEVVEAVRTGTGYDLVVRAETTLEGTALGDSIAVEGVCLTVTEIADGAMRFGLAPETRNRTALEALGPGSKVNLERSVLPTTRMGGHFVQGHVDGTGRIRAMTPDEDALWVEIATDPVLMKYVVSKGYAAIDGTSLTVVRTGEDWFDVTLVAYTQAKITLPTKSVGDLVNLEVDVLAKYVEKLALAKGGA